MKPFAAALLLVLPMAGGSAPEWRDLFHGKDFTGRVNVNTARDPW
jgi:hypothetical protein